MAKRKSSRSKQLTKTAVAEKSSTDNGELVSLLRKELCCVEQLFERPGQLDTLPSTQCLNPGMSDIQIANVTRLGHRDKFARPHDWENLIPLLKDREELLWIVDKKDGCYSFSLGLKSNVPVLPDRTDAIERMRHFDVICDHFARRAFPESRLTRQSNSNVVHFLNSTKQSLRAGVTCVTGIPSPKRLEGDQLTEERSEDRRPFAGLNDVLESLVEEPTFTLVFTVAKATVSQIREKFERQAAARDVISPLLRQEISRTQTVSSDVHGDRSGGTSTSVTQQDSRNIFAKAYQLFTGSTAEPKNRMTELGRHPAASRQSGSNEGWSEGWSSGQQDSDAVSTTQINSTVEFLDNALKLSMEHLKQTGGTGGYFGSVMVYSSAPETSKRVASCLCATLSGAHSYLRPMSALPFKGEHAGFQLTTNLPVQEYLGKVGAEIQILNCDQAGMLMLLPDTELPGCQLKRSVFYGRPRIEVDGGGAPIGEIAFFEKTLNRSKAPQANESTLRLSAKDVCSHLLVVGTTGSGKTERTVHILNQLPEDEFQVIVIETAKKTYRDKLKRSYPPLVYTLGDSSCRPLRLNPFFFDPGTSLKRHISILSDAMTELLPVEALIGPKLREATEQCYKRCGWDIERGEFTGVGDPAYPDMIQFNHEIHRVCESLEDYGAEVRGNYKGALLNRGRIFLDDIYQDIFAFQGNRDFAELFPRDTIIEMEEMPPSEINMPAFLVSLIIERLRAFRFLQSQKNEASTGKKIVLVIEEAHNVLHRRFEEGGDEREAGRGKRLIEQVVRLLQEGRSLGIGVMVVDQSAQYLADAVIANTNTKIVHRQEDGNELKTIGEALGLSDDDWPDMQKLEDGECIVKTKSSPRPVKLSPIPAALVSMTHSWNPFDKDAFRPFYQSAEKVVEQCFLEKQAAMDSTIISKLQAYVGHQIELLRFVIGRHLIMNGQYELLELSRKLMCLSDLHRILIWRRELSASTSSFVLTLGQAFLIGDENAEANASDHLLADLLTDEARKFVARLPTTCWISDNRQRVLHDHWLGQVEAKLVAWAETVQNHPAKANASLQWLKGTDRYWKHLQPQLVLEYAIASGHDCAAFVAGQAGIGNNPRLILKPQECD